MGRIIGLSGKRRSGKDSVCRILAESNTPLPVKRASFADALRDEVGTLLTKPPFNMDYQTVIQEMQEDDTKEFYRNLLLWYGTEFRRRLYGENYWTEKVRTILEHRENNVLVFTDTRFLTEANIIREHGGLVVRVTRIGLDGPPSNHPSETELDYYNFDIVLIARNLVELNDEVQKKILPLL